MPFSEQAEEGGKILAGVIDPDNLEKIRLLLYTGSGREMGATQGHPQDTLYHHGQWIKLAND